MAVDVKNKIDSEYIEKEIKRFLEILDIKAVNVNRTYYTNDNEVDVLIYAFSGNPMVITLRRWDIKFENQDFEYCLMPGIVLGLVVNPLDYYEVIKVLITRIEDFLGIAFHDLVPDFGVKYED